MDNMQSDTILDTTPNAPSAASVELMRHIKANKRHKKYKRKKNYKLGKLTPKVQEVVCRAIERGAPMTTAAEIVGVSRMTMYTWMNRGKTELEEIITRGYTADEPVSEYVKDARYVRFYMAVRKAISKCEAVLSTTVFKVATEPNTKIVREYVTREVENPDSTITFEEVMVKQTITEQGVGDGAMALKMLERRHRDHWAPPRQVEVTGAGGGPVEVHATNVNLDLLPLPLKEALYAALKGGGSLDDEQLVDMGLDQASLRLLGVAIEEDRETEKRELGDSDGEGDYDGDGDGVIETTAHEVHEVNYDRPHPMVPIWQRG